jgi:hypothetical protein
MYNIIYFKRNNGYEPARAWIEKRDNSIKPNIYKKIDMLNKYGPEIFDTKSIDSISGCDSDFYELKNRRLNWRLGFYYNRINNAFVLLHGWKHYDNHEEEHQREIEKARQYLHEYLESENRK